MPRSPSTRPRAAPRAVAATPMAFARVVADAYRRRGLAADAALQAAGITTAQLRTPLAHITARQFETLSAHAMQELDDEGLGAFGRRLPWGSYGMLARASVTAPTLGIALQRWCRHHGLLTDDLRLHLEVADGWATLRLEECRDLAAHGSPAARDFCLLHVLRNAHGLACWYIESRIALADVGFPCAPPPHRDAIDLVFQRPTRAVRFGTDCASMRFDARYLALPIRRDERAMRQMLQRALPVLVLPWRRDRLLVEQVREQLLRQPEATRNAAQLARQLHVSPRTLHRQLREEGASLQALKDETRAERACELLARSRQPLKQIASAAGFRNEKSFARAFLGWTGETPGRYRERMRVG